MSDTANDIFYENVYEKYWDKYKASCQKSGVHPSTSDFLIWLDENGLIPEPLDMEGEPRP